MKHLVLVIALAAFSASAFAEGSRQNEAELRLVRAISVNIDDQVMDGCLSNPDALKVEAELVLRRSGISITETYLLIEQHYALTITPLGRELRRAGGESIGSCVAMLELTLWRVAQLLEGHPALITAYKNGILLTGYSKSNMQEELRTSVSEYVSDLANEILKAQGN
jgi:hypothetical protein